jgi:Ca2+-binding EF-hand superfamily protein
MKQVFLKILHMVFLLGLSFSVSANYYQNKFYELDSNGDNTLSVGEFRVNSDGWMDKKVAAGDLSWESEEKRVRANQRQFNKFDTDGDGTLSFEEFTVKR